MNSHKLIWPLAWVFLWILGTETWAHVTPNVRLSTTRQTVKKLLPQGKLFIKNVNLNSSQISRLDRFRNWDSNSSQFKFFVSRGENDRLQGAMVSMTQFTRHGPVVVATALDANGIVTGVVVTDVQMEPLTWVGPILKTDFLETLKGKDSSMELTLDPKWKTRFTKMTRDFALVIANAVKKSAQLFDLVFKENPADS